MNSISGLGSPTFSANNSTQDHIQPRSLHVLQLVEFSKGENLSEYIQNIQEKAETSSSFFSGLSLKDHQSILMLILAHWIKYNDSDYIKLFIQVLPHYLTAIEDKACENFVKSYLPTFSCGKALGVSIKNLLSDATPVHRSRSDEFACVKALLLDFGIPAIPVCPMGTFSYSLQKWRRCQNPNTFLAASVLTQFLSITEDWNVDPLKKDKAKTAFDFSCHILSVAKDSKFWFRMFHANKASPIQYLTNDQIYSYYKTARAHHSFHLEGHEALVKELIPQNISLACAVSRGLASCEIGPMLKQLVAKKELIQTDIEGIKDMLALPWELEDEDTAPLLLHLETIKTLAEKTSAYKYVLLHKVRDKAEEIAAMRRILIVKEHAEYATRRRKAKVNA